MENGTTLLRHSASTNWLRKIHNRSPINEIPHPKHFTWGWLCASGSDFKAAIQVLDHCFATSGHEKIQQSKEYTLGHIGKHNIVICPPNYSQTCLSVDAENIKSVYPSIQQFLIVGIASGMATPNTDVRLGDVVIGERAFFYDVQTGIRGDTYTPKNMALEQSCRALNTKILLREGGFQEFVQEMVERQPAWFRRPQNRDLLFDSSYPHTSSCNCSKRTTSRTSEGIVRPDRSPDKLVQVHYGTVASLSQDLKDVQLRDRLSVEENVLCVDKQSAGTMEKMNCLPVLGVCNYGDSHEYEYWHNYASLTAAICAKVLLDCIVLPPVTNTTNGVDGGTFVSATNAHAIDPGADVRDEINRALEIIEDKMNDCRQMADEVFKVANYCDQNMKAQVKALKNDERKCKQELRELREKIQDEMQQIYVPKPEWIQLKKRVNKDTQRIQLAEVSVKVMWGMAQIFRAASKATDKLMAKYDADIPKNLKSVNSPVLPGQSDPYEAFQSPLPTPRQANGDPLAEHISSYENGREDSFPPSSPRNENTQIGSGFPLGGSYTCVDASSPPPIPPKPAFVQPCQRTNMVSSGDTIQATGVTPRMSQGAFLQHQQQTPRSEYHSNFSSPHQSHGLPSPATTNSETSLPKLLAKMSTEGHDLSQQHSLSVRPWNDAVTDRRSQSHDLPRSYGYSSVQSWNPDVGHPSGSLINI